MEHIRSESNENTTMIRLLIVESQPAVRRGLRMRLNLEPDVMVVGETGDGLSALTQAVMLRPDVVLLDTESVGIDGVKLIAALRRASTESAVVVLSLRDDAVTRGRALSVGAAGFVSKHECGDGLTDAIRRAASRETAPPAHTRRGNGQAPGGPVPGYEGGSA
jgi:DNA-binding NarL/FixJ family response regulator